MMLVVVMVGILIVGLLLLMLQLLTMEMVVEVGMANVLHMKWMKKASVPEE